MAGLRRHLEIIQEFSNPDRTLPKIRNQAGRYFKGIVGGSSIRGQIYQARSFNEILKLAQSL
jgi:tRNA-dihydrouridine synthase